MPETKRIEQFRFCPSCGTKVKPYFISYTGDEGVSWIRVQCPVKTCNAQWQTREYIENSF
jgi:formate dehydrogenase maturation protein FdhE